MLSRKTYDHEVVPLALISTVPFLRAADEVANARPRVAYLCRLHAYEKAHSLDWNCSECAVIKFKSGLLQWLDLNDDTSISSRVEETDAEEITSFYLHYTGTLITGDRARLQTAQALFQVVCAVYDAQKLEQLPHQVLAVARDVEAKQKTYEAYNILPLDDSDGVSHAILHFDEIKAVKSALRSVDGLTWPCTIEHKPENLDLFDWLGAMFGFQRDNVRNQREHLIMLLANVQRRLSPEPNCMDKLDDRAVDAVMNKFLQNYHTWCKFLGCCSRVPRCHQEVQSRKILCIGLYLLIWGEAANVRFMPECICYLFHNMVNELCGFLAVENSNPSLIRDDQFFLRTVITPIYRVIEKEAMKSKDGKAPHSAWCNYDDLNEYFWSADCFSLGWPMNNYGTSFESMCRITKGKKGSQKTSEGVPARKSIFVEIRTFWHIFHSFNRLWTFYILALQAMVIIAWMDPPVCSIFTKDVLYPVSSIFITASFLRLLQSILDAVINNPFQRRSMSTDNFRSFMKLIVSLAWAVVIPLLYIRSFNAASQQLQVFPVEYFVTVAFYFLPSILAKALPLFPIRQSSDWGIVRFHAWWSQPKVFVGRGMHESHNYVVKYGLFWIFLLASKFTFSYLLMIRPLVMSTKSIISLNTVRHQLHEFYPQAQSNYGVLASFWAPVILVFFFDTQMWYSILSGFWGDSIGDSDHQEEVLKELHGLSSRFHKLPGAVAQMTKSPSSTHLNKTKAAGFSHLWNEIICSFREEDIVNDREMDLLLVPYSLEPCFDIFRWPILFLAGKIPFALEMSVQSRPMDSIFDLWKRICSDELMKCAVIECYISFKRVLQTLVATKPEKRIVSSILEELETNIFTNTIPKNFIANALPTLFKKVVELVEHLRGGNPCIRDTVVLLLQDIMEVVTRDLMVNEIRGLVELGCGGAVKKELFASIELPEVTPQWEKEVQRLYLLLTVKNPTLTSHEATRRLLFFTNSLFMNMPCAPEVDKMLSFSVLTPYYNEETIYSTRDIVTKNDDGLSIMSYLQNIYPDEWNNFMERIGCKKEAEIWDSEANILLFRHWVSLRGQTLFRTVRGMMYYERALRLQAYLEMANEHELQEGYKAFTTQMTENKRSEGPLYEQLSALVDLKFSYVISCQQYGYQKQTGDRHATEILNMMLKNPSLRVAYIDEVEDKEQKLYYSVLVKASNNLEQEIYRIRLPGPSKVGEGKPENQNNAIVFSRGEALQAIDMNQDNYLEEALKMRNLLQEFNEDHGVRPPTILGVCEHVFTGRFSALAWLISYEETGFFTAVQRVFARALKVRFHYGHPDVFDRIFHITRGGISKASRTINLSEDIFGGFNSTLRGGNITHHEYIQVGKGRDIGINQVSMFEAKVSSGNGEQTLSRDLYRLGNNFDFFRMLSLYFTTIASYINALMTVLSSYAFLYGGLYLSLSGLGHSVLATNVAMIIVSVFQTGLLRLLSLYKKIRLEKCFITSILQLPLFSVFFTFACGMKAHYYGRTILHGGSKYRATGRGFVMHHEKFAENYRAYSRSHFTKALELMTLLIMYHVYASPLSASALCVTSLQWFLILSWFSAPFIFNPLGFEWQKIVDDWYDWLNWISCRGNYGGPATKCWDSWWEEEQEPLLYSGSFGRFCEILLSLRFFLIQYWLVYHLRISNGDTKSLVYGLSWLLVLVVAIMLKVEFAIRNKFKEFTRLKPFIFIGFVLTCSLFFLILNLSVGDMFVCLLAFLLTGRALLLIAIVCKPIMEDMNIWSSVKAFARGYDFITGTIVFTPVAVLAFAPFISKLQTWVLFNRGLQINTCAPPAGKRQMGLQKLKKIESKKNRKIEMARQGKEAAGVAADNVPIAPAYVEPSTEDS